MLGCSTLTPEGVWLKTHNLIKERKHHVSWEMEDGLLLIGGVGNVDNTELGNMKLFSWKILHVLVFS